MFPLYHGPPCALHPHQRVVYVVHGGCYCALCLPDEPGEDLQARSAVTRIKARALREEVRLHAASLAVRTATPKDH